MIMQQPRALNAICMCHLKQYYKLRGYRFIVTRVINSTDTVVFTFWFTDRFHLTPGKQRQLPLPQPYTVKQNPASKDVALEVRFVSSESPHGQPDHWTHGLGPAT